MRTLASLVAQSLLILRGRQVAIQASAVLQLTLVGAVIGGVCNAAWYRFLDETLLHLGMTKADMHEVPMREVLIKTAISFFVWAPVCNSAYLLSMPLLRGEALAPALANVRGQLIAVMGLELSCFMPYNLIAFRVIPLSLRAPIQACVACIFSVGLALMA